MDGYSKYQLEELQHYLENVNPDINEWIAHISRAAL